MRRADFIVWIACFTVVLGLVLLFNALADADPVAFFGTPEEHQALEAGRERLLLATAVLLAAGALLAVRGKRVGAIIVALSGVTCSVLALGLPETLFAWLAFLTLAPAALGAALAACRPSP